MAFLTNWLTQICIVIIVISVMELLIPKNRYKHDIQFVLQLIFITILLQPFIQLFQLHDYSSKTASEYTMEQFEGRYNSLKEDLILQRVAKQGEQMERQKKLVEEEWKQIANHTLKEAPFLVKRLILQFKNKNDQFSELSQIDVYLEKNELVSQVENITFDEEKVESSKLKQDMQKRLAEAWEIDEAYIVIVEEGGE